MDYEPFVSCIKCHRKQHQVCVLYHQSIWPNGFVCKNCTPLHRNRCKYNVERLPHTQCSQHIESRVNDFLMREAAAEAGKVHIRVVSSSAETVEVKSLTHRHLSDGFPYQSKTILAFQEVDGYDACSFGMYVQEYNAECPAPNTRRVYIAYLDSVHFFKPKKYRTAVYHEILLGYMDYAKRLGYTMVHIWASPPRYGEDYIFDCHPLEQKMPTSKRLKDWYGVLIEKGKQAGVISMCKNIVDHVNGEQLASANDLPYFDGDHLPKMLEEWEKARTGAKKDQKGAPEKSLKSTPSRRTAAEWRRKFTNRMVSYKNQFFVVWLHETATIAKLPVSLRFCNSLLNQILASFDSISFVYS